MFFLFAALHRFVQVVFSFPFLLLLFDFLSLLSELFCSLQEVIRAFTVHEEFIFVLVSVVLASLYLALMNTLDAAFEANINFITFVVCTFISAHIFLWLSKLYGLALNPALLCLLDSIFLTLGINYNSIWDRNCS